jgi:hypothetical protein
LNANRAGDTSLEAHGFKLQNRVHQAALAKIKYTCTIRLLIDAKWITAQQKRTASASRL